MEGTEGVEEGVEVEVEGVDDSGVDSDDGVEEGGSCSGWLASL